MLSSKSTTMLLRTVVLTVIIGYLCGHVNAHERIGRLVVNTDSTGSDMADPHQSTYNISESELDTEPVADVTRVERRRKTLRQLARNLSRNQSIKITETVTYERDRSQQLCDSNGACDVNQFCDYHYKKCEYLRQPDQHCRSDKQCVSGFDCIFGRCLPTPTKGQQGSRCLSASDCQPHLCCAREHGERICKPKLKQNQFCFIPNGGLAYSLNELCPCETGFVCGKTMSIKGRNGRELPWLQEWNSVRKLRCVSL